MFKRFASQMISDYDPMGLPRVMLFIYPLIDLLSRLVSVDCNSWYRPFVISHPPGLLRLKANFMTMEECLRALTHWGRDKMAAISQTMFSNAFS